MRFVERYAHGRDGGTGDAEFPATDRSAQALEDDMREEFCRRIPALELRLFIEIPETQFTQNPSERIGRKPDVDHDSVDVKLRPPEFDVHHVCRAVQTLSGAKYLPRQTVGDHHVGANRYAEHVSRF